MDVAMPTDQTRTATGPRRHRFSFAAGRLAATEIWRGAADRHSAQRDAIFVFLVRAASAGILYVSQIILARWMGAADYGIYVWVWTLVLILGGISHLGVGPSLMRLLPYYRESGQLDLLRGLLIGSRWLAFVMGSVVSFAAYWGLRTFAADVADLYLLPAMLGAICIPLFAMTDLQDGLGRAQGWMAIALVPPYILRPLVLLSMMALAHAAGFPMDAISATLSAIAACWAASMVQTLMVQQRLDDEIPAGPRAYDFTFWIRSSLPLLAIYASELVLQNTDVLVLSAYLPPHVVGMYFAAAKTMALVMFVHYAVGSAVAKDFAALHARGDRAALVAYARDAVSWTFWPSLAATAALLVLGEPLLWLFSPAFTEAYPVMVVLAAGFLFRASVGPAEFVLNALGEQKACAAVAASAAALDIGLNLVLVPMFGMIGAAIATAVALATAATLYAIVARRRLGLDLTILQVIRRG